MRVALLVCYSLFTIAFAQPRLQLLWETSDTTLLRTPESVLLDPRTGKQLFVSCMGKPGTSGDGYIAMLDLKGRIKKQRFVDELDDPRGMALRDDTLWVCDMTQIHAIDPASGIVYGSLQVAGAVQLNDIALMEDGTLYVTDSRKDIVHIWPRGKSPSPWVSDTNVASGPNGIAASNGLVYLGAARSGKLQSLQHMSGKLIATLATGLPKLDGIVLLAEGGLLVSTWTGTVHYVLPASVRLLLDRRREGKNTADMGYDPKTNTVFIPSFYGHTVAAYQLRP